MFEMAMLLGSAATKTAFGFEQASEERKALEKMKEQEELKATQEAIVRDKQLERTLGTQRAEGAARGVTPTSASLSAISQGTFDTFAEDATARKINLQLKENNINQAEENSKRKAWYGAAGNLFDAANRYESLGVHGAQTPVGKPSGNELDMATVAPKKFDVMGPLDLKQHTKEEINANIGF